MTTPGAQSCGTADGQMVCPCTLAVGVVGVVPMCVSQWSKLSPVSKAATVFFAPLLLIAAVCAYNPEVKQNLCNGALSCNQVKSILAGVCFAWLMSVKSLATSESEQEASTGKKEAAKAA